MKFPTVSVIMSVYNGERYLAEAIDSILCQTFKDFEFIIINDGSNDGTSQILSSYSDKRMRVFDQENRGLTYSLNRGISEAKGIYIARMDADDISFPDRLGEQVVYLDTHPEIGVIGTFFLIKDETRKITREVVIPTSDDEIKAFLIKGNPFAHTSIMVRKSILTKYGGYDEYYKYGVAEDYALWVSLAPHTKMVNIPKILVIHREHRNTSTYKNTVNLKKAFLSAWIRTSIRFQAFRTLSFPLHNIFYVPLPFIYVLREMQKEFMAFRQTK